MAGGRPLSVPPPNLLPLTLGPLVAQDHIVERSGFRWLVEDGHLCRPGELIAFCNLGLISQQTVPRIPRWFDREADDLQVALAAPVAGRLRHAPHASQGGWIDKLGYSLLWTPDFVIGHLEDPQGPSASPADGQVRLMFASGARKFDLVDDRSGLLSGWHACARAWWGEGGPRGTVIGLGICDQNDVFKGDNGDFQPLFAASPGPAQSVFIDDPPLVNSVRVTLEQRLRTPADRAAIQEDFRRSALTAELSPGPEDWMYLGALMGAIANSPTEAAYEILSRDGLSHAGPADAVVMSLASEAPVFYRHKRLGYTLRVHHFQLGRCGAATLAFLKANFDIVPSTVDQILADYIRLYDHLNAERRVELIVLNIFSSNGFEDIATYAAFDEPLDQQVFTVRNKALNVMLHDLARQRDIAIVDLDALGAEHGGRSHIADGMHQSGTMQTLVRAEILRTLRERKVPGF